MPYVTLVMPRAVQAWPNSDACWSPTMPASGTGAPSTSASDSPTTPLVSTISGSNATGTPKSSSSSASQEPVCRSYSRVREALVASVTCNRPPLRRQASQESTVPKASSPFSARARAPGTESSSQAILVAEKYGSSNSPVLPRTRSRCPAARNSSQRAAVRRSCHTIAGAIGCDVARSQMTVVSRWLVMPMPATSAACTPALRSASTAVARCAAQISSGSISTHPGCGKERWSSCCATPRTVPSGANAIVRELVVPWSNARITLRSSPPLMATPPSPAGGLLTASSRNPNGTGRGLGDRGPSARSPSPTAPAIASGGYQRGEGRAASEARGRREP